MEERRTAARVKLSLNVTWEGALAILTGEITDLSTTGCFILTDDKVKFGELIRLDIHLPRGGHIYLWAKVVYQMPEIGFGVCFTGGEEDEVKRLRWLVQAELRRARD